MSSVTSVNPAVSDLLQTFSSDAPASLSTALSAPAVQSALQNASPADLLQLSVQALQLQQVAGLFGNLDASQTTTDPGALVLQALANQSSSSTAAPVSSIAGAQDPAEQEASDLFGTNSATGAANSSISLLG